MIKNDRERQKLEEEIRQYQLLLNSNRDVLRKANVSEEEIAKHVATTEGILNKLTADLEEYKKLKDGYLPERCSLDCIGELLVKVRISQGLSQRELADKIGVNETQLCRYERTGYRGAGLDRIKEVLGALGVHTQISFEKIAAGEPEKENSELALNA